MIQSDVFRGCAWISWVRRSDLGFLGLESKGILVVRPRKNPSNNIELSLWRGVSMQKYWLGWLVFSVRNAVVHPNVIHTVSIRNIGQINVLNGLLGVRVQPLLDF